MIQFILHIPPCGHKNDGLCSVSSRRVQYGIDIFALIDIARCVIFVLLPCYLQSGRLEYLLELSGYAKNN